MNLLCRSLLDKPPAIVSSIVLPSLVEPRRYLEFATPYLVDALNLVRDQYHALFASRIDEFLFAKHDADQKIFKLMFVPILTLPTAAGIIDVARRD